ncbi:MAG: ribosomal-processing cysteine protease Prp [Fusobacteriaceae bacterium]
MTKIEILKKNGRVIKYSASGHSGFSEHGKDIVCASISSILLFPLAGLTEILKLVPKFEIEDGDIKVDLEKIKKEINEKDLDEKISVLLETMIIMLKDLEKQYPKFLKLVEKEEK